MQYNSDRVHTLRKPTVLEENVIVDYSLIFMAEDFPLTC